LERGAPRLVEMAAGLLENLEGGVGGDPFCLQPFGELRLVGERGLVLRASHGERATLLAEQRQVEAEAQIEAIDSAGTAQAELGPKVGDYPRAAEGHVRGGGF